MITNPEKLTTVVVTDCGSTTTKALLFEKTAQGWRQTFRGEAPTTVEEPVADVTVGARNAFTEVEELSKRGILNSSESIPFVERGADPTQGIDLYLSTSSAGGGLQMMVAGIVGEMSAESAQRAALGAGAIVMDVVSADDGREDYQKIEKIRQLRPDIVLLTGGVDGGSKSHVIEMAEILRAASPKPRFGDTLALPVIYAGNREVASEVSEILGATAKVEVVDNVRPELDRENLGPAREAIHEIFLSHVMSHSPGYDKLLRWTPVAVMPTPAAVGDMVLNFAKESGNQVLCADIGGATTDVFSVFKNDAGTPVFNRTVSANYGMSYSVANVLVEAGCDNIKRWLPYELSDTDIRDQLRNKMIRPTSIPQTMEDLWLEQAVCREALRLSLRHHRSLAVGLSGVQQQRSISDIFSQKRSRYELVDMMKLDVVIGSGGVLSHAPHRLQAALMMLEGFGLQGVTEICVDSIFMMPHLGVLSSVHPQAAKEIFMHDCLVKIAHSVVPVGIAEGELARIMIDGNEIGRVSRDEVGLLAAPSGKHQLQVEPLHRSIDVGAGPGKLFEKAIEVAPFGILFDGRNRPLKLPENAAELVKRNRKINTSLGLS